ncbi:hypothetical protein OOZ63_20670 [Paucibacter sp. PLA-PC-4]|uniref:hypothetical protein n=1 Tax=Paucibacter sp. PLA-PC-4 TaxID=2993655 RepID=UPI00224B7DB0|nr:hypothetical protein [Paucibacter sp. PLA-PC-4]MCX2864246.1 hypothetical protein [Paucibacter sp. PLA-PC-4]
MVVRIPVLLARAGGLHRAEGQVSPGLDQHAALRTGVLAARAAQRDLRRLQRNISPGQHHHHATGAQTSDAVQHSLLGRHKGSARSV